MNALFFWFFSIGMIVCGLGVVLGRNPVAGALSFVLSIFFMSGLFFMLSAFFLAVVQILVTAGAVMVLFLFIIMLLDVTALEHTPRRHVWMACSMILALGFLYLVALTLKAMPAGLATENSLPGPSTAAVSDSASSAPVDVPDDTHQIGHLLFTTYVAPFEVTSLLILVATVGVIVLCKQDEPRRPAPHEEIVREAPPRDEKREITLTR